LEAVDAAEVFDVREDGLDDLLSASVARLSFRGVEDRFHPVSLVALGRRVLPRLGPLSVLGRDEDVDLSCSGRGALSVLKTYNDPSDHSGVMVVALLRQGFDPPNCSRSNTATSTGKRVSFTMRSLSSRP
jgi:hypothetical protein